MELPPELPTPPFPAGAPPPPAPTVTLIEVALPIDRLVNLTTPPPLSN